MSFTDLDYVDSHIGVPSLFPPQFSALGLNISCLHTCTAYLWDDTMTQDLDVSAPQAAFQNFPFKSDQLIATG